MQKSMWLLAFLPYLHWFGSLVNGATVLTSPFHPVKPSGGLPFGYSITVKARGPVLPAAELFADGNALVAQALAPEDYEGSIPTQAWRFDPLSTSESLTIGVSVTEQQGGVVPRSLVMNGIYTIFLAMKQDDDFRSGIFEINIADISLCDLVMFAGVSSGLQLAPRFAHVTQLHRPPRPTADNTTSSHDLEVNTYNIKPYLTRPMDELGMLINFMDMLVRLALPPAKERPQDNIKSIVPSSGVKVSYNLTQDDHLTFADLISVFCGLSARTRDVAKDRGQATRSDILLNDVYQGEILVVPSNSSLSTSPLIEASVNASAGTATAKKRWSIA